MPRAQNQVFREMPGILGISRNAKVNQGFREMPGIFRHFAKCLITQFGCNIYTLNNALLHCLNSIVVLLNSPSLNILKS